MAEPPDPIRPGKSKSRGPDSEPIQPIDLDGDERDWVPQSADVSFKPLVLSVSQGY